MCRVRAINDAYEVLLQRRKEIELELQNLREELECVRPALECLSQIMASSSGQLPPVRLEAADDDCVRADNTSPTASSKPTLRELVFSSIMREGRRTTLQLLEELGGRFEEIDVHAVLSKARSERVLELEDGVWFFKEVPADVLLFSRRAKSQNGVSSHVHRNGSATFATNELRI
jgi:hypothetical protein